MAGTDAPSKTVECEAGFSNPAVCDTNLQPVCAIVSNHLIFSARRLIR